MLGNTGPALSSVLCQNKKSLKTYLLVFLFHFSFTYHPGFKNTTLYHEYKRMNECPTSSENNLTPDNVITFLIFEIYKMIQEGLEQDPSKYL